MADPNVSNIGDSNSPTDGSTNQVWFGAEAFSVGTTTAQMPLVIAGRWLVLIRFNNRNIN